MRTDSFALIASLFPESDNLFREFESISGSSWLSHVNQDDYQGDWGVLPLRCAAQHEAAHPILQAFSITQADDWCDLPIVQSNSVWHTLTQFLQCPIKSARLMRLAPGAKIAPHVDNGLSLESGEVRLHLPLQTDKNLHFFVNQQAVPMKVGQLWYINAEQEHWVENLGSQPRVNLVLDCEVNAWLKQKIAGNC